MAYYGLIGAVLYAKDLDRLAQFYAAVAGIERQTLEEGFVVLGLKPSQLIIVRVPRQIAETIDIATPPDLREDTPVKLVFGVKDIAHARHRAAELGGVVREHDWQFEGVKVCDGNDPEGNIFQLREMR